MIPILTRLKLAWNVLWQGDPLIEKDQRLVDETAKHTAEQLVHSFLSKRKNREELVSRIQKHIHNAVESYFSRARYVWVPWRFREGRLDKAIVRLKATWSVLRGTSMAVKRDRAFANKIADAVADRIIHDRLDKDAIEQLVSSAIDEFIYGPF